MAKKKLDPSLPSDLQPGAITDRAGYDAAKADGRITELQTEILYIGPAGQHSPLFGPLVVGQRYQAESAFADYLVGTHPDYWQRPDGN